MLVPVDPEDAKSMPHVFSRFEPKKWSVRRTSISSRVLNHFQATSRPAFPNPVSKLTENVEMFGVELDRLVALVKVIERIAQVA